MNNLRIVKAFSLMLFVGCGPNGQMGPTGEAKRAEQIDAANDPAGFKLKMNRQYAALPLSGEAEKKPFPGSWWPMQSNGIAQRWNGTDLSPAEKYDQLVSSTDDPSDLGSAADWEVSNHGTDSSQTLQEWSGHCNGWASFALNEGEPQRDVTVQIDPDSNQVVECSDPYDSDCVQFLRPDIEALGTELYYDDGSIVIGHRCEEDQFNLDASGRIVDPSCRDANPGTFHIVAANMLGNLHRGFIMDVQPDDQVWNYPIYKFNVLSQKEIALADAVQAVGSPMGTKTWVYDPNAVKFIQIEAQAWLVEDPAQPVDSSLGNWLDQYSAVENYSYILEIDATGDIIGGEWTGASKLNHPDFIWYSYSHSRQPDATDDLNDDDNSAIRYSYFKQLLALSRLPPPS